MVAVIVSVGAVCPPCAGSARLLHWLVSRRAVRRSRVEQHARRSDDNVGGRQVGGECIQDLGIRREGRVGEVLWVERCYRSINECH